MSQYHFIRTTLWLVALAGIFSSCRKTIVPPEEPPTVINSLDELQVNPHFDFSSQKEIQYNLKTVDNQEIPVGYIKLEIYDESPQSGGRLIKSGFTDSNGEFIGTIQLNSWKHNAFVATENLAFESPVEVDLVSGKLDYCFGCIGSGKRRNGGFSETKAGARSLNLYTLGGWDALGMPAYMLSNLEYFDNDFLTQLNNSIPEGEAVYQHHPGYLSGPPASEVKLTGLNEVWISFVGEHSLNQSVLAFYTFPSNSQPNSVSDIDSLFVIFPNASFANSGGGLESGHKVRLGEFPANTAIGFALLTNGWSSPVVSNGDVQFYTNADLNPELNPSLKQHHVLLHDELNGRFVLGFEETNREFSQCDHDFNDLMFVLSFSDISQVETAPVLKMEQGLFDNDNDGISNFSDDFPNDYNVAVSNFYPTRNNFGCLAFEDLWPSKGDYDFNDLVLLYNFNLVANAQNEVSIINAKFYIQAMGGSYNSGCPFTN